MNGRDSVSRRRLLQFGGLAAGAALAGCSDLMPGEGTGTETQDGGTATDGTGTGTAGGAENVIRLGAEASGWVGREPESIADESNPTLELESGTTYELVWENLDGTEHELQLLSANDEELEASDSASEEGATVSMEFEATEEMASYRCEYHPERMRGQVTMGGGGGTETDTAEGTATATESNGDAGSD